MKKSWLKVLEKCFLVEIGHAMGGVSPLCQMRDSKPVLECEAEDLIARAEQTLPGRFPVQIKGWLLTERGRLLYCQSCKEVKATDGP